MTFAFFKRLIAPHPPSGSFVQLVQLCNTVRSRTDGCSGLCSVAIAAIIAAWILKYNPGIIERSSSVSGRVLIQVRPASVLSSPHLFSVLLHQHDTPGALQQYG